ncbi:MAG: hypothetical protein RR554_10135 [Vagococcus sp.]|uniref:hypothetical protein n=1 Tax=Vagococcus sp. TaxID=1933889 RepID=UPI002FC9E328
MNALSNSIVTLLLFLWFIHLILKTKPIKESFRGVIIVLVIGAYLLIDGWSVIEAHESGWLVILVSLVLGFVFGLLRGCTMKLWYNQNAHQWLRKGSWLSVVVFILGMVITHIIIEWLTHDSKVVLSISQTLHMGISMLGSRSIWRYRLSKKNVSLSLKKI